MDRRQLHRLSQSSLNANGSATPLNLAPGILETVVPGYGLISNFVLELFGFDIGIFVSVGIFLVTFSTSLRFLWMRLLPIVSTYALSSVYFDQQDDELFPIVLDWIAEANVGKKARNLKAVARRKAASIQIDEEEGRDVDPFKIFHVGKWIAKSPPRYEPNLGSYYFWHRSRLFVFERQKRERAARSPWDRQLDEENIFLKTPGWSTEPIKELLKDIKAWAIERKKSFTVVNCPQSKDTRRYQGSWVPVTSRPSRPMSTIVLDPFQKARIIADINEYLLPSSRRWYATHGIPYRRGYLFHGPPGTGKSSLCFALAGLFGLDIYIISLLDPGLTEGDLILLFNHLPRRCVVLLEDIDSAGLNRDDDPDASSSKSKNPSTTDAKQTEISAVAEIATELRRSRRRGGGGGGTGDEPKAGISLSGLLNAIDGVASHEGRVLVMTTNFIETLDSALLRPGRVDMQIEFTLATKHQIREIFIRMFCNELHRMNDKRTKAGPAASNGSAEKKPHGASASTDKPAPDTAAAPPPKTASSHVGLVSTGALSADVDAYLDSLLRKTDVKYTRHDLEQLADEFTLQVPADTFSPAEVQNFLILRKKDPWQAVRDVEAWRDQLVSAKERNSKVVAVN
jgi:chaperone BCS1